jgi:NAD(P)-dependent dehydrogenase (short-subunit alcohol dehydrogenase family)
MSDARSERSTRVAVVAGGGRGLGRIVAVALARRGDRVALVGRSVESLGQTERLIVEEGGIARAIPADISDPSAVEAMARAVERDLGQASILVNAAGIFGPIQPVKDGDPLAWIETLSVNLIGPYLTCRAFIGPMVERGWGRIVNFSSATSLHPPGPFNSAYATSKVALNQLTRHLAAEVAGSGVTANVIHPGDVKTDMWADIRDRARLMGSEGDAYRKWVEWVETTGGDDRQKAADLVLRLTGEDGGQVNGQFLWIADPLQAPIPSWDPPADSRPWN